MIAADLPSTSGSGISYRRSELTCAALIKIDDLKKNAPHDRKNEAFHLYGENYKAEPNERVKNMQAPGSVDV